MFLHVNYTHVDRYFYQQTTYFDRVTLVINCIDIYLLSTLKLNSQYVTNTTRAITKAGQCKDIFLVIEN